jgi:hypothetical protein
LYLALDRANGNVNLPAEDAGTTVKRMTWLIRHREGRERRRMC